MVCLPPCCRFYPFCRIAWRRVWQARQRRPEKTGDGPAEGGLPGEGAESPLSCRGNFRPGMAAGRRKAPKTPFHLPLVLSLFLCYNDLVKVSHMEERI